MLWERSRIVALMALGLYFIAGGSSAANTPDDYSASHQKMVQVLKEIAARTADEHPYLGDAQARRFRGQLQALAADAPTGMEGNVAVHTDPAYWLPAEPLDNVARFMASLAVSGVPMPSTDLRTLPAAQRPIVQNWLRFYRENKELLLFGTQRFLSADPHYSLFSIHRGETALWSVFTESFPGCCRCRGKGSAICGFSTVLCRSEFIVG